MAAGDELILEGGDVLDALVFEGFQPDVKGLLFRQQSLNGRQVAAEIVGFDVGFLKQRNSELNHRYINFRINYATQIIEKGKIKSNFIQAF